MIQDSKLKLLGGAEMPAIGLGMWKIDKPQVPSLIEGAARCGYRHFDCACDYGNEAEVGDGLARVFESGICPREEVWVTSKLWNTYHAAEQVRPALERSLSDLHVDYLDLYLIHFPIALKFVSPEVRYPPGWVHDPSSTHPQMELVPVAIRETWEAMEQLVRDGLVRNIGVCNFNCALLRDLLTTAEIAPSVLQIESHPYQTQEKLLRFCRQQRITVTAFRRWELPRTFHSTWRNRTNRFLSNRSLEISQSNAARHRLRLCCVGVCSEGQP